MRHLPSRHRRLDGALADLPLEEPMLLTELDGFLTGIVVCPEAILPGEWMQNVWGSDEGGVAPFDDPIDVQWFADAVEARRQEIARDLARGRLQPIFEVDDRNGDALWEVWIDGFAEAMALRPDSWAVFADAADTAEAIARLTALVEVAEDDTALDGVELDMLHDRAPAEIAADVQRLYATRARRDGPGGMETAAAPPAKVGRNDPCVCGSGRKSKRCCG